MFVHDLSSRNPGLFLHECKGDCELEIVDDYRRRWRHGHGTMVMHDHGACYHDHGHGDPAYRIGILSQGSGFLELYASMVDRRRAHLTYHARHPTSRTDFEIVKEERVCNHNKGGCMEITDGENVQVRGLSGTWTAVIDEVKQQRMWYH